MARLLTVKKEKQTNVIVYAGKCIINKIPPRLACLKTSKFGRYLG